MRIARLRRRRVQATFAALIVWQLCSLGRAEEAEVVAVEERREKQFVEQLAERPEIRPLELLPMIEPSAPFSAAPVPRNADLSTIPLTAAPPGGSPAIANPLKPAGEFDDPARLGRNEPKLVSWAPPALSHKPVYFEDVSLERYGQTRSRALQPVISGGKFLANVAILPYKMGVDSPHKVSYDVGFARPGSPTPGVREHLPFSLKGILYQGAATTGGVFFLRP